ncbi:hypothetical protein [Xanthobacter autotrophicus]|uniref:hypothetical protein n=1 Tax=Xanthobacter autotrophicus TaxID=280 RepID=UPI00372BFCC7
MDPKPVFDINRLPAGAWLRLDEAMQFALWGQVTPDDCDVYEAIPLQGALLEGLAADDADGFNAAVANLQRCLQAAALAGRLPMRGQPKRFREDEPNNTGRSELIGEWWFSIDAVRGFDFEDGSISPFSHEADNTRRYTSLIRLDGALQPNSPDEWRFVIVERAAFIAFLRDHLGAATTEGLELAPDTTLPTTSEAELLLMIGKINDWFGGTSKHPLNPANLHRELNNALAERCAPVPRRNVEKASKKLFPTRSGSGRPSKVEAEARKLRQENYAKKMSLAKLLFSTGEDGCE